MKCAIKVDSVAHRLALVRALYAIGCRRGGSTAEKAAAELSGYAFLAIDDDWSKGYLTANDTEHPYYPLKTLAEVIVERTAPLVVDVVLSSEYVAEVSKDGVEVIKDGATVARLGLNVVALLKPAIDAIKAEQKQ